MAPKAKTTDLLTILGENAANTQHEVTFWVKKNALNSFHSINGLLATVYWQRFIGNGLLATIYWQRFIGNDLLATIYWQRFIGNDLLEK